MLISIEDVCLCVCASARGCFPDPVISRLLVNSGLAVLYLTGRSARLLLSGGLCPLMYFQFVSYSVTGVYSKVFFVRSCVLVVFDYVTFGSEEATFNKVFISTRMVEGAR